MPHHIPLPRRMMAHSTKFRQLLGGLCLVLACACGGIAPSPERPKATGPGTGVPRGISPQPVDPRQLGSRLNRDGTEETGDGEEEDQSKQQARALFLEQIHKSPPGLDWRLIERRNQARERLRRKTAIQAAQRTTGTSGAAVPQNNGLGSGAPIIKKRTIPGLGNSGPQPLPVRGYWEEVGSRNQAGHTRCMAASAEYGAGSKLYLGSAGGGVWETNDAGVNWNPIADMVFGGADELMALPGPNGSNILVFRRGSDVFRSTDNGVIWTQATGFPNLAEFRTLQRLHDAGDTLLALVRQPGTGGVETWLYQSTDAGATFVPLWKSPEDGRGDFWTPQGGPLAGTWIAVAIRGRIYISQDGGGTFNQSAPWATNVTESHLCGSELGGPTLYAVFQTAGQWHLFRGDNQGATIAPMGTLPDYWGLPRSMVGFAADPLALVYGGVNAYRSVDGGLTFQQINHWGEYYADPVNKLHADIRGLDVVRTDIQGNVKDHLYLHTDGGTYRSVNKGLTVENISLDGLGVAQFYSTHTSTLDPDRIAGGTQDQGYQTGSVAPYFQAGPSSDLDQLISGDYGHLISGDGTHDLLFSVYPGVVGGPNPGFVLVQDGATNPMLSSIPFPPANHSLWLPPIAKDPTDPEAFYFLADGLWHATRNGSNWDFALHSTQDFGSNGRLFLTALDVSPADPTRMVAATFDGSLWWSIDSGVTWTLATDSGPLAHYFYGSRILFDPSDPLTVIACGSGYGTAGVRISYDGGDHWEPLGDDLPSTLFFDIEWDPQGSGDLYAATEAGAYRYEKVFDRWQVLMGVEAPATVYWSVEAVPETHRIRFGTYGRGIWDYVLALPERPLGGAICSEAVANTTLEVGRTQVIGQPYASEPTLDLRATKLPPGEAGYFMISDLRQAAVVPPFSDGFLCLGFNFQTFGFQSTGTEGEMTFTLDTTALPAMPIQPALAGQTWYFQAWHTDFVMTQSGNFTTGVGIYFH